MKNARKKLLEIISYKVAMADFESPIYTLYMDPNRPYDGYGYTFGSSRGKTTLEKLTIRDIRDCFIRGVLLAAGDNNLYKLASYGKYSILNSNDIYEIPIGELDPMAIFQNMACEIEKLLNGPEAGFEAVTKLIALKD